MSVLSSRRRCRFSARCQPHAAAWSRARSTCILRRSVSRWCCSTSCQRSSHMGMLSRRARVCILRVPHRVLGGTWLDIQVPSNERVNACVRACGQIGAGSCALSVGCSFCISKGDESKESKGDGKFEDDVEGMGMGSGEGKKNISDEIENETELEGTQQEQKQEARSALRSLQSTRPHCGACRVPVSTFTEPQEAATLSSQQVHRNHSTYHVSCMAWCLFRAACS
jgi:hypothetical protein